VRVIKTSAPNYLLHLPADQTTFGLSWCLHGFVCLSWGKGVEYLRGVLPGWCRKGVFGGVAQSQQIMHLHTHTHTHTGADNCVAIWVMYEYVQRSRPPPFATPLHHLSCTLFFVLRGLGTCNLRLCARTLSFRPAWHLLTPFGRAVVLI